MSLELNTEILSRLPVKSLLKFRSVSKSWLALISSPEFIKTLLNLSANNKEDTHHVLILGYSGAKWNYKECLLRSLFFDSVTEAFDFDYPIENASEGIWIVGTCNGLFLLVNCSENLLLWNPTTRMNNNLPDFRPRWKTKAVTYGFGYDELHNDYKVVGIFYKSGGSDGVDVKIFSLKSDSSTSLDYSRYILPGSNRKMMLTGPCLFANGKLRWDTIAFGPNISNAHLGRNISYFDLANEKWEMIEKPSNRVGETDLYLGTLGSDLCVFSDYKRTHLGAWVINEYGVKESWIKKFTIRYPNDHGLCPPFFMSINVKYLRCLDQLPQYTIQKRRHLDIQMLLTVIPFMARKSTLKA